MDRIAPDCARMSSNPLNVVRAATTFERRPLGVPSPGLRGRYLGAVTWSIAGLGVSRGATFLASMFTARLLGAESFGGFAIVQSTVSVAAAFAGAGLGVTASRYLAEFRASNPERAGRLLGLASAVALISGAALAFSTFTSAPFIAGHVLHAPALLLPLRIASLLVLFTALNGYQTGALAGLEAFRTMAMVNLCSGVVSCPVIIFCVSRRY